MAKKIKYKIANIELSKIVSLLGKILGFVVKEQEGLSLYNKIEEIRSAQFQLTTLRSAHGQQLIERLLRLFFDGK